MSEFKNFIFELRSRLKNPLPGKEAQWKMAPVTRLAHDIYPSELENVRTGSVLILLFPENDQIMTVFIRRSVYDGVHSGQISFPGGKHEPFDDSFEMTAIRETEEEIGIKGQDVEILGELTDLYIPPSNFLVKPFIGFVENTPDFNPDPNEVDSILTIGIHDLFMPDTCATAKINVNTHFIEVPCYHIGTDIIWGATAMIVSEMEVLYREMPKLKI